MPTGFNLRQRQVVPDEGSVGFNALAVPVLDAQATLAAMVGVIGPMRGLPEKPSPELIKSIKRELISRTLGHDAGAEP